MSTDGKLAVGRRIAIGRGRSTQLCRVVRGLWESRARALSGEAERSIRGRRLKRDGGPSGTQQGGVQRHASALNLPELQRVNGSFSRTRSAQSSGIATARTGARRSMDCARKGRLTAGLRNVRGSAVTQRRVEQTARRATFSSPTARGRPGLGLCRECAPGFACAESMRPQRFQQRYPHTLCQIEAGPWAFALAAKRPVVASHSGKDGGAMACPLQVRCLDSRHANPAFPLPPRRLRDDLAVPGKRGIVRLVSGGHAGTSTAGRTSLSPAIHSTFQRNH